jgi:hypothetical protein
MLIPLILTCYFRLSDGLRGKGQETFLDELRVFGITFFVMCCISFFIDFILTL